MTEKELKERLLSPLAEQKELMKDAKKDTSMVTGKEISMTQFVNNPTGKGSAYVAKRSAIRNGLNLTFVKLLRESRKQFYAIPYIYENGDIMFYVKVPSEDYEHNKISYDVLIKILYDNKKALSNRNVKFFSNCPSFIYTYTYVFNKEELLIDEYKSKFPNEALTMPPVIRNPIQSMGYEKSLYIACRYLLDSGCLSDTYIKRYGKIIDARILSDINNRIADPELIVSIYQHAKYKEAQNHRKELDAQTKKNRDEQLKQYAKTQKEQTPKHSIFTKSPRGNITARKALKSFVNIKPKKNIKNK